MQLSAMGRGSVTLKTWQRSAISNFASTDCVAQMALKMTALSVTTTRPQSSFVEWMQRQPNTITPHAIHGRCITNE